MKKSILFFLPQLGKLFFLLFSLITMGYANPTNMNLYPFSSTTDATRFQSLTKEIRCVVCQNQNIADSNAPLANDLRQKIYTMILEKKSDNHIKKYLVKRYGEFILLQPPFNASTALLWLFPLVALMTTFGFLLHSLFKQKKSCSA